MNLFIIKRNLINCYIKQTVNNNKNKYLLKTVELLMRNNRMKIFRNVKSLYLHLENKEAPKTPLIRLFIFLVQLFVWIFHIYIFLF